MVVSFLVLVIPFILVLVLIAFIYSSPFWCPESLQKRRTWGSSFIFSRQLTQSHASVVVKETYLWHISSLWFLFLVCFSIAMETIRNSFSNSQCPTRNVYFITHCSEWGVLFNFWPLTCTVQPGYTRDCLCWDFLNWHSTALREGL